MSGWCCRVPDGPPRWLGMRIGAIPARARRRNPFKQRGDRQSGMCELVGEGDKTRQEERRGKQMGSRMHACIHSNGVCPLLPPNCAPGQAVAFLFFIQPLDPWRGQTDTLNTSALTHSFSHPSIQSLIEPSNLASFCQRFCLDPLPYL